MPAKTARRRAERRRHPRADARLSMRLEGAPENGQQTHIVTESQNISVSGVYCTSSYFLAPTSKVALTIVLPRVPGNGGRQELVKCEGIVVRCQPVGKRSDRTFELACTFSELDARRRGLIEQFVTWRNLQALRAAAAASRSRANGGSRRPAPARRTAARAARPARRTTTRRRVAH